MYSIIMRSESFISVQVQNGGGKEGEGHWDLREWPTT